MGIFDIFTPKQTPAPTTQPVQQQAVPTNQVQPGNLPIEPAAVEPNNPTAPVADPEQPVIEEKDKSPLDQYGKLWEDDPNKKKEDETNQPVPLDQTKVHELVAKADFSKNIPPEIITAITAGGEEATVALTQAMNHVAQQVMTQSIVANNKLNDKAIEKALELQAAKFPEMLRNLVASDHLKSSNPIFSNPAVKPMMDMAHNQFLQKFPNETNEQITKRVEEYILAMGEQFAPKSVSDDSDPGEQDWSTFLEKG